MERNEALNVIKKNIPYNGFTMLQEALETLIPELRESEDEVIRKELIAFFKENLRIGVRAEETWYIMCLKRWISWLEKQGGQKSEWNEPDKKMLGSIIECIDGTGLLDSDQIDWIKSLKSEYKNTVENDKTLLEKQNKDDKVIFPKFTFDDVLALECCMKEVEKKDEKLYNQLQSLHNRVHDAYWLDREGEKKETLCDKCRKEQPCHSCQDITELGRCALEHHRELVVRKNPKFKVGDWIVFDGLNPVLITNIKNNKYEVEFTDNGTRGFHPIDYIDRNFHLWTIRDAKDGDILINHNDENTFIFKGLLDPKHPNCPVAYCGIDVTNEFMVSPGDYFWEDGNVKPASKKQRDILFQKMAEAGYEWDAENKVLIKQGDQESINGIKPKFGVGNWIVEKDLDNFGRGIIVAVRDGRYILNTGYSVPIEEQDAWQLVQKNV